MKQWVKIGINLALLGGVVVVGARVIEKLSRKIPG